MILLKGTRKEQRVREWFNSRANGKVPTNAKVIDIFRKFELDNPDISYGCLNSTMKKIVEEGHSELTQSFRNDSVVTPVKAEVIVIKDMKFPNFPLHRTGKKIDSIFSDHEELGGLYGGTVNIVIGESGVGKSTVLLDVLASVQKQNPDAKILYVSSEMTRNDILFYYKKTPSIADVPTLLLMDYVKSGQLDQILMQTFTGGYDIILLDSYQDVLIKLKEVQKWKSTFAESWLTNVMIDSAEKSGCSILAIQHMTKGGQYVGSTYLKHATTSMMEILFDAEGLRYITFSKNRRGGSSIGKRLYFSLKNGEIVYDDNRFEGIEEDTQPNQIDISKKFEDVFINGALDNIPFYITNNQKDNLD